MTKTLFEKNNETFKTLRESFELRFSRFIRREGVNKSYLIKVMRQWADNNGVSDKDLRIMAHLVDNNFTWGDEDTPVPCNSTTALKVVLSELREEGEAFFSVIPGKGLLKNVWCAGCQGFTLGNRKTVSKILSYKRENTALKYIQNTLNKMDIDFSVLDN